MHLQEVACPSAVGKVHCRQQSAFEGHCKNCYDFLRDHRFPMGEHRNFLNISRAYEENFRTSCALQWSGHLGAEIVKETFSQMDIAPTLLGLLCIQAPVPFRGRSFFSKTSKENIVPCAQPYDGGYVCAFGGGHLLRYSSQTRSLEFQRCHFTSDTADEHPFLEKQLRQNLCRMA